MDAVQMARARMDALMQDIGHTLAIAVWGNHGPTIVHWQEPPQAVTANLRLGDVMPLLSSATGRCFAAYAPPKAIAALLKAELAALAKAPRTDCPTNMAGAQILLQDTRLKGLGRVRHTLLPGIAGFCAPVFDATGHVALGLVSLGAVGSFDSAWDGSVARALKRCAQQLSSDLGAPLSL
jgi:DNA-binding IclR family transcriptional regulator